MEVFQLPTKAGIELMEISFRSKSDRTETVGAKVILTVTERGRHNVPFALAEAHYRTPDFQLMQILTQRWRH